MATTPNINSYRVFDKNAIEPDRQADFVLYWMQINRRLHYNYALEYAVGWANKLGKPLLIYEGLNCDYPWACDRFHKFILEGMAENSREAAGLGINYYPFVEDEPGAGKGLLYRLAEKAALVISDEYPVFIMREQNDRVAGKIDKKFTTVDSNGLIPLGMTQKAPYNAYFFRKIMQRHFVEAYTNPPEANPLESLKNRNNIDLPESFTESYPRATYALSHIEEFISGLPIRHDVEPVQLTVTRAAGLEQLSSFMQTRILRYDKDRNHPDLNGTSGLSPWLHFGKVSEYETVKYALEMQPEQWSLDDITFNKGSTGGFFNGDANVDGFLDEVITWRETGFHFAHHTPDYDSYESLPDWVHKTLDEHWDDQREYVYSLEELEAARTHDPVWNAAQRQLVREGYIHNYLRMLWGKKVIEWTENHRVALAYLIELNNQYALDGRDPNSYSGIFWCFGRFDRPWQERPIFGKLRYMTSKSARNKVRLKEYLKKYGE